MNRNRWLMLGILATAMVFTMACGMLNTLMGGRSASTVSSLWSDVPPVDGATKADIEMPLFAKLFIEATMQGRIDYIAYTTSKTPQEIQEFYTKERMTQSGWNTEDMLGCTGETNGDENMAGICFFGKDGGGKQEGLAIVMAIDEEKNQTQIFYARIDLSGTPTPNP